jgi:type I restriction enzyme R subunit
LQLDALGYSDTALQRAWSDARNEDIAASIIGFVRQAALGDPLTPFDLRVHAAMRRMLARGSWSEVQRKWLKRIEEQIIREIVVDPVSINGEPFSKDGGFAHLDKVFGGQLALVLADINEQLWEKVA